MAEAPPPSGPVASKTPGDAGLGQPSSSGSKRFGTFPGVFTPSILTILGVVMYLRVGWVVGNAGLQGALIIVVISHLITLTTGLSISTIATNRSVGAGGAYYIISRSLGGPAGAAIGIPLFLGQALSVSFYVVGFVESLQEMIPGLPVKLVGTAVCAVLTGVSLKSAEAALKTQYFVMIAIALSLVSFVWGGSASNLEQVAWEAPAGGAGFAEVFAVFFPAVTGIMAGLGMSGDLKNPRKSLPRGTLLAILVGFAVYLAFPVWLAMNATSQELMDNRRIVWDIAAFPSAIFAGVWGATLSSAIGSLLTAPRTIQALAVDGLAPRFLAKGSGPYNEPRVALAATFVLAEVGILLGNLNAIANVLTMFFLATYGLTNLACGLEKFAANPSFRPEFRVPAWLSLAGGIACFYVMSIIDLPAMVAALVVCAAIYLWVQRRSFDTTYGDARHGIWSAIVRTALHQLRRTDYHAQNWRPNVVIMGGAVDRRPHLLELGSTIVQDRGIVTYFQLLRGDVREKTDERARLLQEVNPQLATRFPNVFFRVDIVSDIYEGSAAVAQSYGVGSFEANTVMLGWMSKTERSQDYVRLLANLTALDRSLLLIHYDSNKRLGTYQHIQIWWGGLRGNGGFMLLLAFLITNQDRWRSARVTVVTVVSDDDDRERTQANVEAVLADARLSAESRVLVRGERTIQDIMAEESRSVDLAIIGIRLPKSDDQAERFTRRMNSLLEHLPTTIMVHSARGFQGEPVLFDRPEATTAIPPRASTVTPSAREAAGATAEDSDASAKSSAQRSSTNDRERTDEGAARDTTGDAAKPAARPMGEPAARPTDESTEVKKS